MSAGSRKYHSRGLPATRQLRSNVGQASLVLTPSHIVATLPRQCRVCGCTDDDCRQCIERTGEPCRWVSPDLCSACAEPWP
jgi:hypothetical protein